MGGGIIFADYGVRNNNRTNNRDGNGIWEEGDKGTKGEESEGTVQSKGEGGKEGPRMAIGWERDRKATRLRGEKEVDMRKE